MTLPNNISAINRKLLTFHQENDGDRSDVEKQKNEQSLFATSINSVKPDNMAITRIKDLSFNWRNFEVLDFNLDEDTGEVDTKKIFATWELVVVGMRFEQLSAINHNFLIRFGSGEPLLLSEIADDSQVWSVKHILSESLENDIKNRYVIYYGLYLADTAGLEELDQNGIQVKLEVTLFNPDYYG